MAALDFPNSPTVGQQYAAANGATYQWDGTLWYSVPAGSNPASGPAGGDLSGTFPNPQIAPLAIHDADVNDVAWGKLTSVPATFPPGGNATGDLTGTYPSPTVGPLKITNAKINDVAYGKVTGHPTSYPPSGGAGGQLAGSYPSPSIGANVIDWTKMAGNGCFRDAAGASLPTNSTGYSPDSWYAICTTRAITCTGAWVLVTSLANFVIVGNIGTTYTAYIGFMRDGAVQQYSRMSMGVGGSGGITLAVPAGFATLDQPPAGGHTYSLAAYFTPSATFRTYDAPGILYAWAFA